MPRLSSVVLLFAALAGCAPAQQAATDVRAVAQAATSPTLSTADTTFLNEASRAGITEVTFGQLARRQASRAAVRDFGFRMTTDHTGINQQLTHLASAKQVAPVENVDALHQATYDRIAALKGRAFDRAYLDNEVADLSALLTLYQDEAAHGTDAAVKAFAVRFAPMVKTHLDLARKLGGRMPPPAYK